MASLEEALAAFVTENKIGGKGALSIMLVVTRKAITDGLPLDPEQLLTDKGGQVTGASKGNVQAILKDYGIDRVLAAEGGRTSRGSIENMRLCVAFLNDLHAQGAVDLHAVERWWVARVQDFFASKPFKLKLDTSRSLRAIIRELLDDAFKRERQVPGMKFAGAVLQHLVGAKLTLALPDLKIEHHGFSVADAPGERHGDFFVGDVAIHVTTSPSESLIQKCQQNLAGGLRAIIVTAGKGVAGADLLLANAGIEGRVDVFEVEQFVATNIYERSRFAAAERPVTIDKLVEEYNRIVDDEETDPGLRIEVAR